jgi:pimeloyl-ACP methyl ester carboxylesterase
MFAIAPVNVAANSFGSSIALGMTVRCPELVQTLCVHEPPLLGLVGDDPTVAAVGARASEVVEIIEAGELETGAKTFCDLALGPDVWDVMTTDERALMIAHARTFAEEQRDPDWATIDLDALALLPVPVVLTKGDQSPPFFGAVVDRLASTIPNAEVRTISGAGHIPHLTHPTEYVRVVTDAFVR